MAGEKECGLPFYGCAIPIKIAAGSIACSAKECGYFFLTFLSSWGVVSLNS